MRRPHPRMARRSLATATGPMLGAMPQRQRTSGLGAGRGPHGGALPHLSGYWPMAWLAAVLVLAVLVVRAVELWAPLAAIRPAILVVVGVGFLFVVKSDRAVIRSALRDPQMRLVVAYALWAVVTTPFALYRRAAFDALVVFPFAIFITLATLLVAPTRRNLDRVMVGFLAAVGGYGFVIVGRGLGGVRLTTGGMYDPNDLAAMIAMTLPIGLHYVLRAPRLRWRLAAAFASGVFLVVIAQTSSRGGILAVLAGIIVFALGQRWTRTMWLAPFLAVGMVVFWARAPQSFRDRAISILSYEEDYNMTSTVGRKEIWKRGIQHMMNHPITGVGLENFAEAEGLSFQEEGFVAKWFTAHNAYIQAGAELGIPGGLILLSMLWLAGRRAFSLWRPRSALHHPGLFAALAAFCTSAFFLSHAYAYLLFGLLALIAFADRVAHATSAPIPQMSPSRLPGTTQSIIVRGPRRGQAQSRARGARPGGGAGS